MLGLVALLACSSAPTTAPEAGGTAITVFAAASLTEALGTAGEAWSARTGNRVTFTFDASSRLAKQLDAGAAADVFVSADEDWMDHAAAAHLLRDGTRRDLLTNTLVAVVPSGSHFVPSSPTELADPRVAKLALAGENVPAGKYARAALEHEGAWDAVSARVVDGDSVRTALAWVAGGEADAGVVYATDARAEPRVTVAFAFPDASHPPIRYPGAVLAGSAHPDVAADFLAYCTGDGRAALEAAGFGVAP